ncbi:acetyltransferase [Bacteroides timonensis]|uniref:acetyltransferase n=1 Tax=Bacteroides timonensis TaxID=1470345 RepID=UPI0004B05A37|nr:acetyltransferase [Bacteroides timonensis]
MKNLIIIAAGGLGRTLCGMAESCVGYGTDFIIKGFIDDNLDALNGFDDYPPIIGKISDYIPQKDDVFVCSIGGLSRKGCIEKLISKGGDFISLIHNTARICRNVKMGKGNVIGAFTSIGVDAVLGSYNLIQSHTVIGHDVIIGDWNRIDTHVTCVGGTKIGNGIDIYTSAVINHGVVVEDMAHVGACSFVIKRVKAGTTVYGNPAKRL